MALTSQEVDWVAHLARLELSADEKSALTSQLSAILDYINQLQSLDSTGVEPLAHALEIHNIFREDVSQPSLPVDEALTNAPERKGDYYSVPAVFED